MENANSLGLESAALAMILRDKKIGREMLSLPPYFFSDPLLKRLYEFILDRHIKTTRIPTLATISARLLTIADNKSDAARLEKLLIIIYKAEISQAIKI